MKLLICLLLSINFHAWATFTPFTGGAAGISPILTTKGDVVSHNGTGEIRVGIGTDGQILEADSATSSGLSWKDKESHIEYRLIAENLTANSETITNNSSATVSPETIVEETPSGQYNTSTGVVTAISDGVYLASCCADGTSITSDGTTDYLQIGFVVSGTGPTATLDRPNNLQTSVPIANGNSYNGKLCANRVLILDSSDTFTCEMSNFSSGNESFRFNITVFKIR